MKLTLEIPNEHAPALLALLSDLMPVRLEPQADPAEGHPELPLMPATQGNDLAAKWIAAGGDVPPTPEQLAAMSRLPDEDPALADVRWQATPDPTQRVLNWPQELLSIAPPELPEGKTKWVYRGTFSGDRIEVNGRAVFYHDTVKWCPTCHFSTIFHHVEAI